MMYEAAVVLRCGARASRSDGHEESGIVAPGVNCSFVIVASRPRCVGVETSVLKAVISSCEADWVSERHWWEIGYGPDIPDCILGGLTCY